MLGGKLGCGFLELEAGALDGSLENIIKLRADVGTVMVHLCVGIGRQEWQYQFSQGRQEG